MSTHLYGNVYIRVEVASVLSDLSDFGLLGSKVHKMGDSLIGCRRTAVQNLMPLALSSAEKSITAVQTRHMWIKN